MTLSNLSVSVVDPFLSVISHSWTKKGDTKNSTEKWYSYPTDTEFEFIESSSIFLIKKKRHRILKMVKAYEEFKKKIPRIQMSKKLRFENGVCQRLHKPLFDLSQSF